MSAIDPRELRYASISAFGLILMTTILKWSGIGGTRYTPMKPTTSNATAVADKSIISGMMDPDLTTSSPFNELIDAVLTPLQLVVDFLLTWANVWDTLGWPSIFLIVPMMIMLVIIASFVIRLVETALP